ncbi:MAG: hypothetical protein ACRDLS_13450 [Solirubrobacteraceae bacterium]
MAALVLAITAAGCGGNDGFGNEPRPPQEITVSATIAPTRISVSPSRFGAGPIELLVSNQTRTSQRLTLRSETLADGGRELKQSTGPINPGDTASLKADLDPGTYTVSVQDEAIDPARIVVGPPRPSAQDRLLQP